MTLPQDDLSSVPDVRVQLDAAYSNSMPAAGGPLNSSAFIPLTEAYCELAPPAAWRQVCSSLRRAWAAGAAVRHQAHVNDPNKAEKFHGEPLVRSTTYTSFACSSARVIRAPRPRSGQSSLPECGRPGATARCEDGL